MINFQLTILLLQMTRIISVLFLFFLSNLSFSQSADIRKLEELKNKIRQATYYDSEAVFRLGKECISLARKLNKENEVGLVYQYYGNFSYYSNNIEDAKKYYKKSIDIANKTKDQKLKNSTEIRLVFIALDSDVLKAETGFRKLLAEAKRKGFVENQIEIYNGLGIMYEMRLQDDKAVESYLLGLRISERYHKNYSTSYLLNNLGLLKLENKQYDSAKADLERALLLATKSNETRLRFNILNNLGLANKKTGDLKASVQHYKQTVVDAKKIGFPTAIVTAYINLSSSYLDNNQVAEAAKAVDSALVMLNENMDHNFLISGQIIKGLVSVEQKRFEIAADCIAKAKKMLKNYQDPSLGTELLSLQAKLAEAQGNFQLAYQFEQQFHALSDSIREISSERELTRHQTIYGKERMEHALTSLNQKNKILKTESELKSVTTRFIVILFIGLVVLICGLIYIYSVRRSRKMKALFSQKLIEQIDDERSRISKDLHDDIGQSLAVVKSKLNLYSTGKITKIDGIDAEIGEILEQTRHLSHQLHPTALEKIGLERSLNALIEKAQDGTDLVCSFEFELDAEKLSLESNSQIYRIIQECIANTIKHAQATALKVSCLQGNNEVVIEYRDNGIGFSEANNKFGLGLLTMRERASIIGGKLEIKTGLNKGVLISISI
jgi:signal transduction histidine kinase